VGASEHRGDEFSIASLTSGDTDAGEHGAGGHGELGRFGVEADVGGGLLAFTDSQDWFA
jgi:hypothetical protein